MTRRGGCFENSRAAMSGKAANRKSPAVSVIVPVYNVLPYLDRCMESLLNQTLRDLEIILVDDGSTDGSGKRCDEYGELDPRVRVIHKKNGGLSDARNAGLQLASGEYIGYADSDDWVEETMYERLLSSCRDADAQVAICRYVEEPEEEQGRCSLSNPAHRREGTTLHTDETAGFAAGEGFPAREARVAPGEKSSPCGASGEALRQNTGPDPAETPPAYRSPELLSRERALEIYLTDPEGYSIYNSVWSKLFLADMVKDMRFFTGHDSEDIPYTTEAFCRMERAVYLDEPLYHYAVGRPGSLMEKREQRLFRDEIPHWRWHAECIGRYGLPQLAKLAKVQYYKRMLSYDLWLSAPSRKRLEALLFAEKEEIGRLYGEVLTGKGDRLRMRLFLLSPGLYRMAVRLERMLRH